MYFMSLPLKMKQTLEVNHLRKCLEFALPDNLRKFSKWRKFRNWSWSGGLSFNLVVWVLSQCSNLSSTSDYIHGIWLLKVDPKSHDKCFHCCSDEDTEFRALLVCGHTLAAKPHIERTMIQKLVHGRLIEPQWTNWALLESGHWGEATQAHAFWTRPFTCWKKTTSCLLLQQLGFPQRSDLYNLCLQTKKKKKKKKRKKKPVPPM
jgi:hypothetical protein